MCDEFNGALVHFMRVSLTLKFTEPMRILIIEDEPRMLELLRMGLYECGHTVMTAGDGVTGLEIALSYEFDAIVLDIGLPRMNGYELMKVLRARANRTPVLMLTARDTEDDIIRGLDLGADDYLTKPFSFPELVARLQSITRSICKETDGVMEVDDVVVDPRRHSVTRNEKSIDLTRQEFLLLTCLIRKAGQCVTRQSLMEFIWGMDHAVGASALDVLMNSLRAKIDSPFRKKLLGTVRGLGYVFKHTAAAPERNAS
jgi:DNA-binding response OmpR family regulator